MHTKKNFGNILADPGSLMKSRKLELLHDSLRLTILQHILFHSSNPKSAQVCKVVSRKNRRHFSCFLYSYQMHKESPVDSRTQNEGLEDSNLKVSPFLHIELRTKYLCFKIWRKQSLRTCKGNILRAIDSKLRNEV